MKILLIDDCQDTGLIVGNSLQPYEVRQALSVSEAREVLKSESFHLLLIDVTLPDGDGFRVCSEFSRDPGLASIPKILLTGRADIEDKVFGFHCGADDYITKPFSGDELRARVEARAKSRGVDATSGPLRWSCFEFDSEFQRCWLLSGEKRDDLKVTPTEYRLLLALARRQGSPLSREELVNEIWKNNGAHIEKRGVDSHVAHLRKKMGAKGFLLVSVYGKGYALSSLEEDEEERSEAA